MIEIIFIEHKKFHSSTRKLTRILLKAHRKSENKVFPNYSNGTQDALPIVDSSRSINIWRCLMKGEVKYQTTFRNILTSVAQSNAQSLMNKAKAANQLAKIIHGVGRQRAYGVKTQALIDLTIKFPERTLVLPDPYSSGLVIIEVKNARFGLHAPAVHFNKTIGGEKEVLALGDWSRIASRV